LSDLVRDWFQRKLAGGVSPLRGMITVSHEYDRVVGPRSIYAKVSLSIWPNEVFAFESKAHWPQENYDQWVLVWGAIGAIVSSIYVCLVSPRHVLADRSRPKSIWTAPGGVQIC
jgi:hypothetical protein